MKVICVIVIFTLYSTQSLEAFGRPNSKFSERFPALIEEEATRLGRNQQWRQQERKEARKQKRRGQEEDEEGKDLQNTLDEAESVSETLATPAPTPATRTEPIKNIDNNEDEMYQQRTLRNEISAEDDYDEFFKVPEIDEPLKYRTAEFVESRKYKNKPTDIFVETKRELRQRQRRQRQQMKKSDGNQVKGKKKRKSNPKRLQRIQDRKDQRMMDIKKKPLGYKIGNHSYLKDKRKSSSQNTKLNSISSASTSSRIQSRKQNRQQARLTKLSNKKRKPHKKPQHKKGKSDRWQTNKVFSIHQIVKYMLQCQTKTSCVD